MWGRIGTKVAIWLLKKPRLSLQDRNLLTASILDALVALPFRDIIKVENEILLINGKPVDMEMARTLRESATGAMNNIALKFIWEQVMFEAMSWGTYKSTNDLDVFFGKTAVWYGQQEKRLIETLAGYKKDELDV